ncbi:DUF72 domain-containing protein [Flaviaesturariibacter amylovorans]|uniref:DUF72 domain-containing protein n=1 Tax=Flaviaesturariibacter amylovorans TaxID=1084520 RepID=A0ABP8HG56_9BACT
MAATKGAQVRIGTSGWSYKHWRELFYPKGVKTADWLSFYAAHFDTAEINRSFYSLPKPEVIAQWAATVPPGFVFCPKLSRYITHMKKLRDTAEPLQRFFDTFAPLPPEQTGPVLAQLPPMLPFREATAAEFYERLRRDWAPYRFVIEVRHESWLADTSLALMETYGIGFVISQSGGHFPYAEAVTSNDVYLRFHGPEALYASRYTDAQLHYYAERCREWAAAGRRVWAYFNNDIHGYAFGDAQRLRKQISDL